MIYGLILYLGTAHAQPGLLSRICSKLIAEDPAPLAELSAGQLLELYRGRSREDTLKELVFRLRAGLLTGDQVQEFWRVTDLWRKEHDRDVRAR